jgi:hypothetical protein
MWLTCTSRIHRAGAIGPGPVDHLCRSPAYGSLAWILESAEFQRQMSRHSALVRTDLVMPRGSRMIVEVPGLPEHRVPDTPANHIGRTGTSPIFRSKLGGTSFLRRDNPRAADATNSHASSRTSAVIYRCVIGLRRDRSRADEAIWFAGVGHRRTESTRNCRLQRSPRLSLQRRRIDESTSPQP